MLPREKTSVMTVLRHPVDRVFSAYEFSVEVASRFLVHPNLTSATELTKRIRAKHKGVSTLDIWPWKYLVPWMREDLFARVVFLLYICSILNLLPPLFLNSLMPFAYHNHKWSSVILVVLSLGFFFFFSPNHRKSLRRYNLLHKIEGKASWMIRWLNHGLHKKSISMDFHIPL